MREKILGITFNKLCEGYKTTLFTYGDIEKEFSKNSSYLLEELISLAKKYYQLKNSANKEESSEIIQTYKEDFIVESINKERRVYSGFKDYTIETLKELKESNDLSYNKYMKHYDYYFENEENFVTSLLEFTIKKANEIIASEKGHLGLSIKKEFWKYFTNTLTKYKGKNSIANSELKNSPETIIEKFRIDYLSKTVFQLLKITEDQINDIELSGLQSYIINIGERTYETGRFGWTTNNFRVFNKDKTYTFSTSTKDESKIEGKFINIFILQLNKRHLLKISITLDETEQTPFIVYRDFEKVSLKNECEILISKHHGNETIIFDSKKEALEFQTKVLELKEGRNNNYRKN